MTHGHPIDYLVGQHRLHGIEMEVICDGVVLQDGGIFPNFSSSMCQYADERKPHMIMQSAVRNGKKFVIVEEPDLEGPGTPSPHEVVVGSVYTVKVCDELDDIHKSNGYHAIRVRPDGRIDKPFSKEGNPTHRDWSGWVEFLINFYSE